MLVWLAELQRIRSENLLVGQNWHKADGRAQLVKERTGTDQRRQMGQDYSMPWRCH